MIRTLGIRAFLRGGYSDNKEATLVMKRDQPLGLWVPFDDNGLPVRDPRSADQLEQGVPNREGTSPWWWQPPADGEDR